jgi:hypothetical protein
MTGAYCFEKFHEFAEPLISYLFSFVNNTSESKIVKLQTIHALSRLDFFIIKALINKSSSFITGFEDFLRSLLSFIQSDDEKYQLIATHFILVFINSPMNNITSSCSMDKIKEMMFPYINEFIRILCICLDYSRKDKYKIKVKLKIIDVFENLLINYADVLANCEYFGVLINFIQKQSLQIKKDDVENEEVCIYLLQLIPYLLEKFFHLCVNGYNENNTNNYILNLLNHIVRLIQKNYDDHMKGIDNSYIPDLIANIADLQTSIMKYSFKNRYCDSTLISLFNNETVYDLLLLYAQKSQSLIHKFCQYIAELAKIQKMPLILSHLEDIIIYLIELLKSINNPDECLNNMENNILISNVIYALGNIVLNYNEHGVKYYSSSILNLTLRYFENNTTEEIGESIIYTYGKIALVHPEVAVHSFGGYLQNYLRCFRILKVSDSEEKLLSLKGIVTTMMLEKYEFLHLFDELSLALISYDDLPSYFKNIYKKIYSDYMEYNSNKLGKIINTLSDEVKYEIERKLLDVNGRSY